MNYILIVEDDASLANGLCRALADAETQTESCGALAEARVRLGDWKQGEMPLLLLDVNLPDGSGFDFLREVKEKYDAPVIMLTANDMEMDIVAGLEQGADDYITKPFSLAVLRARVAAQLRRRLPRENDRKTAKTETIRAGSESVAVFTADSGIVIGKYQFDFQRMQFYVDGQPVELSRTEQKLLRYFTENQGTTLTRDMLIDRVWSDGAEFVDENALSVAVKRLRDKLSDKEYIRTVYGVGYVWTKE